MLWRVSIPLVPKKDRKDISLGDVPSKEELEETDYLFEVFPDKPPKKRSTSSSSDPLHPVEAAFGRITLFGGTARTVLDEPLALKAIINYLQERDPSLVSAAERAMLHFDNPSLFLSNFKLRQVLEKSDIEKAPATVSSHAIQGKMDKEQEKQQKLRQQESTTSVPSDQQQPCNFVRSVRLSISKLFRPDPKPELEGLQRVSIGIDDNNFPKIFPRRHVDFLDKRRGHKRCSEEQQSQT
ncbi:hypothetical protein BKA57DRAFT_508321 [Linnemannia elongata]|nr:hypothetical protein BKA57DRAFT_508321 [Linnemannia elongata]